MASTELTHVVFHKFRFFCFENQNTAISIFYRYRGGICKQGFCYTVILLLSSCLVKEICIAMSGIFQIYDFNC